MPYDFRSFGPCGPAMEIAWSHIGQISSQFWSRTNTTDFFEEVNALITPEVVWFNSIVALEKLGLSRAKAIETWDALRLSFRPAFPDSKFMFSDPRRSARWMELFRNWSQVLFNIHVGVASRKVADSLCFGPFTGAQLAYVTANYSSIFEPGAGNGYLLSVLQDLGLDVLGMDNNSYGMLGNEAFPFKPFAWSERLREEGRLTIGDEASLTEKIANRTLLICFPAPGSAFPYRTLKRYRELGGKSLLLKFGGLVGVPEKGPAGDPADVHRFFIELSEHWITPAKKAPPFEPILMNNNLFAFERNK